jgi:hypothetical protein
MNATIIELQPVSGTNQSLGVAVNNADKVTGWSAGLGTMYSVVWDATGTPFLIGLPATGPDHSSGRAINESGVVAGGAPAAPSAMRGYVHAAAAGGTTFLGTTHSWAEGINNEGYV